MPKIELISVTYEVVGHRDLTLERRSNDRWAVVIDNAWVLNDQGETEYEPNPSSRTEDFINRTRFTFDEAIQRLEVYLDHESKK